MASAALTSTTPDREPPADDLERRLASIWSALLKTNSIGATDDFFQLGGDSLLAVDLAVRLEREFQTSIPLTSLNSNLTLRHLADLLRHHGAPTPDADAILVPLRRTGTRPPLFCVPGVGGHVFMYRQLVDRLGPDQPVFGLNLPGTDGHEPAEVSVDRIAARFITEIRKVQPTGPYHLAGYSFGGLVAYDMARQLKSIGQPTAVVILLDAFGPHFPRIHPLPLRLVEHAAACLRLPWNQMLPYVVSHARTFYARLTSRTRRAAGDPSRVLSDSAAPPGHLGGSVISDVLSDVHSRALDAERTYPFPLYDGPVTLVRADVMPRFFGMSFDDPTNGWSALLPHIPVHPMPCDHLQMFKGAPVIHLAAYITDTLANPPQPTPARNATSRRGPLASRLRTHLRRAPVPSPLARAPSEAGSWTG